MRAVHLTRTVAVFSPLHLASYPDGMNVTFSWINEETCLLGVGRNVSEQKRWIQILEDLGFRVEEVGFLCDT